MTDLRLVPPAPPDVPDDPFLAALEGRLIMLIAENLLDYQPAPDCLAAFVLAGSRDIYLDALRLPIEEPTENYVRRLHRCLRGLPQPALSRLRHPSRYRNRASMQAILEGRGEATGA